LSSAGYSLEPIPQNGRIYGFWDHFAIWFGADMGIAVFWAGSLLTPGLSLSDAILATIVGLAVGNLLMGLIGLMGARTGVPTMVLARGSLGIRGSYLPSLLNYLQLIGWTSIMIIVAAKAMEEVISIVFGVKGFYILWVIIYGLIVTLWTLAGPEKWKPLQKAALILLLMLSVWLAYVTLTKFNFWMLLAKPGSGELTFWVGLDLVIAMPVSWLPLVADYTRFSKTVKHSFWGLYFGHFLGCGLCYILGALTNVAAKLPDPISIIAIYGLGVPAMLIILFSTTTTAFLDIYSAAVSFKNVFTKANVKKQITIVGVIGTIIAIFFPPEQYEWFLLLIGGAFTSLAAIMLSDYFIIKRYYDPQGLLKVDERYWYSYGVNLIAVIIWLVGFIFYLLVAATTLLGVSIPLIEVVAFSLGSSAPTFILVFVLYTVLMRCIKVGST